MTLYKKVSPEISAQPLPVTHRLPFSWLLIAMAKVGCIIITSVCTFIFFPFKNLLEYTVASELWRSVLCCNGSCLSLSESLCGLWCLLGVYRRIQLKEVLSSKPLARSI